MLKTRALALSSLSFLLALLLLPVELSAQEQIGTLTENDSSTQVETEREVIAPPLKSLSAATGLEATDAPDDSGHSVILSWPVIEDESPQQMYVIEAAPDKNGPWRKVVTFKANTSYKADMPQIYGWDKDALINDHAVIVNTAPPTKAFNDLRDKNNYAKQQALKKELESLEGALAELDEQSRETFKPELNELRKQLKEVESEAPIKVARLEFGHNYHFRLYRTEGERPYEMAYVDAIPEGNWFNTNKINNLAIALILCFFIFYYIVRARRNPEDIFIRRIPGLEAVEDAIGRATEMGKPIFFVHGLTDMSHISTVAAVNILGKITERVAEYGTTFKVTNRDPVVLAVSQETVKESYLRAGRPDLYQEDHVFFVSQDQFSYATGVEGMFLREKPASVFYFGYYFAEALLLTETGAHAGAIQIAGTDSYTQLPFFITTCDYTLMGEELYAASAYLSRNPKLLASLKAQDLTKGLMIIFILLGTLLSTLGFDWLVHMMATF